MSKRQEMPKPPSLAQLFEAPDGYIGSFGWLCGYTADAGFLNDAVERFVRHTRVQRAHFGRIAVALMLDPSNPQISSIDVPGVAHLPFKQTEYRSFRLLHAKVALLAFRATGDAAEWKVRLIVSTGNWTRATMEESLDLTWHVEVSREDLKTNDDAVRMARADIKAAWGMLTWLRGDFFDTRLLTSIPPGREETHSSDSYHWFEQLMSGIRNARGVAPRFFDSRNGALLSQLPEMVNTQAGHVPRNYLGVGSGFFEAPTKNNQIPSVLRKVAQTLQDSGLVTQDPEVDVFVNPRGCQAVAKTLPAFEAERWSVREAHQPAYFGAGTDRSLHAKFILSANVRSNSRFCNSAWVYLGSGNLTAPGFTQKMSRGGGNLEAGVVFAPETLYWESARGVPPEQVVLNVLPVQWSSEIETSDVMATGGEFPGAVPAYVAPPAACLVWIAEGDEGHLEALDGDDASFDVLDGAGNPCARCDTSGFVWVGGRPREVEVRWYSDGGDELRAFVSVIDELGRVAATNLEAIGIDEVWWQLESFPMPPDEEDLPPDGDGLVPDVVSQPSTATASKPAAYPIRRMMLLVENIAAKQTTVSRPDWLTWCTRLEQSMLQAAESSAVQAFRDLKLNPLSPLREPPFRPTFAEVADTPEGRCYERILERIEEKWGVGDLKIIGGET